MLSILITWLLSGFTFFMFGFLVEKLLKFSTQNIFQTMLNGVIFQTVLATFIAFFAPLHFFVLGGFGVISLFIFIFFKTEINQNINKFRLIFTKKNSFLFIVILFVNLALSASIPTILDNESYYIQTIKWVQEYGFVKGLGNLHLFYAQTSPWHVLQALHSYRFFNYNFNDLNGFLLMVVLFKILTEITHNSTEKSIFLVYFSVIFALFLNAPSPDLPIVLLTPLWLFEVIKNHKNPAQYKQLFLTIVFLIFIKITIAPLFMLIIYLIYKKLKPFYFIIGGLFLGLFIVKNIVLSGYPFFPFLFLKTSFDWVMPEKLVQFYSNITQAEGYGFTQLEQPILLIERIQFWWNLQGFDGLINKGMFLLFIFVGFSKWLKINQIHKIIYIVLVIHFIFIIFTSPQYRFFLPEFIFLSSVLGFTFLNHFFSKYKRQLVLLSILLPSFLVIYPNILTKIQHLQSPTEAYLTSENFIIPKPVTQQPTQKSIAINEENLTYFSPEKNMFFYATSDAPLPSVNKLQVDYYKYHLKIVPQLRTKLLKDGFYSKKIIE